MDVITQPVAHESARWLRRAQLLVLATAAYNAIEAVIAIWAGFAARSIALVGFGFDSVIELAAAAVVLWRLRVESSGAAEERIEAAETKVHRFVGITFFLLAIYVLFEAGSRLWTRELAEESIIGIALAVASLIIMPLIAIAKLRAANALHSNALRAEAKETLACAYLSFTLLAGLAANATLGWWWADPTAALLMIPWLVREGREAFEDDDD